MNPNLLRRIASSIVIFFFSCVVFGAHAQARAHALRVHVQVEGSSMDPRTIEAAIAREVGRPVENVPVETTELLVRVDAQRKARLDFMSARGTTLTRSIDLPSEPDRATEMIALLAGNLVRDEASELVRALSAQSRASETQSEATSAAAAEATSKAPESQAKPPPPKKPVSAGPPTATRDKPRPVPPSLKGTYPLNLSLFHPVALYPDSDQRAFHFELGLAYGRVGALEGAALEVGVLDIRHHAHGFLAAGLAILTRGPASGLSVSSLLTYSRGPFHGASFTGAVAYRDGAMSGIQLAPGFSHATDVEGFLGAAGLSMVRNLEGATAAAGVSIATGAAEGAVLAGGVTVAGAVTGFQAAAGVNVAERVQGVQAAGGVNVARTISGVQAAGGVNFAEAVEGFSIAPLNVSRRVRGFQLGVVNIAEEVDGAALGVVSIAKNGRIAPEVFVTSNAPLNVGVKFVVGFAYSELALGYRPSDGRGVPQIGAGAHVALAPRFSLEVGGGYSTEGELNENFDNQDDQIHYGARLGFQALGALELFAGGGVHHGITRDTVTEFGPDFVAGVAFF